VAEIEKQFTRLEAGVAALRRVQANLKRYRAAVLKAACEGRLVPTEAELAKADNRKFETGRELLACILTERRKSWKARGKYKEPAAPDTANLPPLPEGWTWAIPDQLSAFDEGAICAGPFGTIFKARDFRPDGVPIIFLRHVAPGRYLTRKPGFMDADKWEELFKPYSVFGGELLVTKLGEPPGVCAMYPEGIGPAMVTPDVMKMTPNANVALPRFLMHYFNSQTARDFASGAAFGTTRLRLTLPIFREMPVPLPSLAEQTRIVAEVERRLSVVEELESVVTTNLQRAIRLRQATLQQAFSGNLEEDAA
jgi:type I restriction enzyme S subunit